MAENPHYRESVDPLEPIYLPPEYCEAIGRIAVAWSHQEHLWEFAIWAALNIVDHFDGRAVTTHLSNEGRFNLLLSLFPGDKDTPIRAEIKDLETRFNALRIERNRYVHAEWRHGETKPHSINWAARQNSTARIGNSRPAAMLRLAHEVDALSLDVAGFLKNRNLIPRDPLGVRV